MPPKKKNSRKKQNQRKGSATNVNKSTGSSPSANAASTSASNVTSPNVAPIDTPPTGGQSTATSSTVEGELITPGALDLRLSQLGQPDLAPVSESETERGSDIELTIPSASNVLDDLDKTPEATRTGLQEDMEYQNEAENEMESGMKTPTQQQINANRGLEQDGQRTQGTDQTKPAGAPQMAELKGSDTGITATTSAHTTQETPYKGSAQHPSHEDMVEPPQNGKNPVGNSMAGSRESPGAKTPGMKEDQDRDFDEVPLGGKDPALAREQGKHIRVLTPEPVKKPLATPDNPRPSSVTPLERESHEEHIKATHLGYDKPHPSEPFMQSNAVPDAAPMDGQNIAHDGGANLPATEERQNLWAPGQQGFERDTAASTAANTRANTGANSVANPSVPSTTSAALRNAVAASSSSDTFVIEESSTSSPAGSYEPAELEERIGFSRGSQPALWKDPPHYHHEEERARHLTPTVYNDNNAPPTSYPNANPYANHVPVAHRHSHHSPKSLLAVTPNVALAFEPTTSNLAPLEGDDQARSRRESIPLAPKGGNIDGFLNPWTRSHKNLLKPQISRPAIEEAALSTPDLKKGRPGSKVSNPFGNRAKTSTSTGTRTARARSNKTLMPTRPILASKHLHINESQLRNARPSILTPRGVPTPSKQQYLDHGTSSGRSTFQHVGKPPPPDVFQADLENINLDDRTFTNPPRFRNQSLATPAPVFMRVRNCGRVRWSDFQKLSLIARLLALAGFVVIVALVIGLSVGLSRRNG